MPTFKVRIGESEKNMVSGKGIMSFISDTKVVNVCVERQWSRKGEGHVGAFTLGFGYGAIINTLEILGLPYLPVTAGEWRMSSYDKFKGEFKKLTSTKEISIHTVETLYPQVDLFATGRCTTKHDGIAEAILIAHHALTFSF
jgi:hypothetical protein